MAAHFAMLVYALPELLPVANDVEGLYDAHHFTATSNWLVPQHVLLGDYPGPRAAIYPSEVVGGWERDAQRDVERARQRIGEICRAAKVNTFVQLQSELPPQDAWSPVPGDRTNELAPYAADARAACGGDVTFIHFPIDDFKTANSLPALAKLVHSLADRIRNGNVVYIHCLGGRGRTGLLAACLLGVLYDVSAEEALERVQAYFWTRFGRKEPTVTSPETEEQREQVRAFFATHLTRQRMVPHDEV